MKDSPLIKKVYDILTEISWADISRQYFGKSSSWMYNKLDGSDGGFTDEELQIFKGALCDLADRIRRVADSL